MAAEAEYKAWGVWLQCCAAKPEKVIQSRKICRVLKTRIQIGQVYTSCSFLQSGKQDLLSDTFLQHVKVHRVPKETQGRWQAGGSGVSVSM